MTENSKLRLLLDLSYCLHLIKERPAGLARDLAHYRPGEIGISSLTVAALAAQANATLDPAQNQAALAKFLLPLAVVAFDADAAHRIVLAAPKAVAPTGEQGNALLLAAQALQHNATLVTRQPVLYAGIPGVRVQTGLTVAPAMAPAEKPAPRSRPALPSPTAPGALVMAGSHDLSLDLLADWLHAHNPWLVVASAHVGSLMGLLALRDQGAHVAGVHLLDEETGEFNRSHVAQLLAANGVHVVLMGFVNRIQGLMVAPGNPKRIETLADLARDDVLFVNRQPGAGTRLLLDVHLRQAGIDPTQVRGYEAETTTHSAVATAVARGEADCGLGIQAAAQAQGLTFVPLFAERFDLAIPAALYDHPLLLPLLALLRRPDPAFTQRVLALGGYTTESMGRVLAEV